jgi:hypothetical protein
MSREKMARGVTPGVAVPWKLTFGLAVVTASLGVSEWFEPTKPPFTGKLSFVFEVAYSIFGEHGTSITWFALSSILLVGALALRRGVITRF